MTQNYEKSYKSQQDLLVFFNDNNKVRIHNLEEYFQERGIITFADKRFSLAKFASNFIYGVDSQEKLKKYVGIKAFPTRSGFLLENKDNISIDEIKEYFNSHVGEVFEDIKNSTFVRLGIGTSKLIGEIEYTISDSTGSSLFEIITRKIEFEIIPINGAFIVSMLLKQENDYNIVLGIVNEIINRDTFFNLKLIEHNLVVFGSTDKINIFFKETIKEINKKYEFMGIINFTRKKAEDLNNATDSFEMKLIEGTLETKLISIEPLLTELKSRNARLSGAGFVFYDMVSNYFFMVRIDSNEKKKRIEISFIGDVKKIVANEDIESFTKKDDFYRLPSANLSEEQKMDIINQIWKLLAIKFYELTNIIIQPSLNQTINSFDVSDECDY
ncbi:hypothetical protein RSJ42_08610 [Methanosarcina hadiensis]|uniref:hypothetical protein n=1 Tax=Methanosarcina hadiensis TaxID=3078083 RepID=UPI0039775D1E